jgi:hypothetical protein
LTRIPQRSIQRIDSLLGELTAESADIVDRHGCAAARRTMQGTGIGVISAHGG